MPRRSTTGELPSMTLKMSNTHGRYGAVNEKSPRKDMFTYEFLRPQT